MNSRLKPKTSMPHTQPHFEELVQLALSHAKKQGASDAAAEVSE